MLESILFDGIKNDVMRGIAIQVDFSIRFVVCGFSAANNDSFTSLVEDLGNTGIDPLTVQRFCRSLYRCGTFAGRLGHALISKESHLLCNRLQSKSSMHE